jgi:hypothetical protein
MIASRLYHQCLHTKSYHSQILCYFLPTSQISHTDVIPDDTRIGYNFGTLHATNKNSALLQFSVILHTTKCAEFRLILMPCLK